MILSAIAFEAPLSTGLEPPISSLTLWVVAGVFGAAIWSLFIWSMLKSRNNGHMDDETERNWWQAIK